MKKLSTFLALGVMLLASSPLYALTYQTYTNRVDWQNAISGNLQQEDFNAEATGSFSARAFSLFTVSRLTSNTTTAIVGGQGSCQINGTNHLQLTDNTSVLGAMRIKLNNATQAFAFDWRNTDPTGDAARVEIDIDGTRFTLPAGQSGFWGVTVSDGGFENITVSDAPGAGGALTDLCMDDLTTVDAPDFARFEVSKAFLPSSSNAPVNVTMSCDAGVPLVQDQDVMPGNPVTFVLTSIPSTGADCTIAETASGSGDFTVSYDDGTVSSTNCSYNNVVAENEQEREIYRCAITNRAKPATFTVKKEWNIPISGGDVSDLDSEVQLWCSNPGTISNGRSIGFSGGYYKYVNYNMEDGEMMSLTVDIARYGVTSCLAAETDNRTDVEVSYAGCSRVTLGPNDDKTCVVTNTLFFEGIPTLSQYGMAIMALLMLGLGFVGFRRFV